MQRLLALNTAIEAFKSQLADGPRAAIKAEIELKVTRYNDRWPAHDGSDYWYEPGVYFYSDSYKPNYPKVSGDPGSKQTILRYIGATQRNFKERYSDARQDGKMPWRWYEVVRFPREYAHFAHALESFLLSRFVTTHNSNRELKEKERRTAISMDFEGLREQVYAKYSKFDETTDKPSALHRRYFVS